MSTSLIAFPIFVGIFLLILPGGLTRSPYSPEQYSPRWQVR